MKVLFLSCPMWDSEVPPVNLPLLSSVVKNNGHESKVIDLNIKCFRHLKESEETNYWTGKNYYFWEKERFEDIILPKIEKLIDESIEEILDYKPDFVGMSVYSSNIHCIKVVIEKIKAVSDIKIMLGGPQCFRWTEEDRLDMKADLIFTGEGETAILEALENNSDKKIYDSEKLINLNTLPFIDYSDLDLDQYYSNIKTVRLNTESSRGCISKCSFCSETCFWGYRFKKAERIVDELEYYKKEYGVTQLGFNDSLINGNFKEFELFLELLIERDLNIGWSSFFRIDKRMDLEFFKKARKAGNTFMSFGVESGSQKVLNDIKKGITVDEIENNLRDTKLAGIRAGVNWIVGFPTENCLEYLKSLIFLYNNKHNMYTICPGATCGIGPNSDLEKNPEKYGIDGYFCDSYKTKNLENTIIHRFIRLKLTHVWLDVFDVFNQQAHPSIEEEYNLDSKAKEFERIDYDTCYDFSNLCNKSFQYSLISEYLSFFWGMYKTLGEFKMNVKFDYVEDRKHFGTTIVAPYNAEVSFQIDNNSNWIFEINHSLKEEFVFDEKKMLQGRF